MHRQDRHSIAWLVRLTPMTFPDHNFSSFVADIFSILSYFLYLKSYFLTVLLLLIDYFAKS